MNQIAWQIYGGSKAKANTFIGGVASTITTAGALATKLGIASNRITNFKIVGSNIECRIIGTYSIPANCFRDDTFITYYKDYENLISTGATAFYHLTSGVNMALTELYFENATTIGSDICQVNGTGTYPLKRAIFPKATILQGVRHFINQKNIETVYIPLVTTLGSSVGNQQIFEFTTSSFTKRLYCHPSLATNNAGAPDGDITNAIANGWIVRYVTNFTAPNTITNLSVGNVYGTAVQLNFTAPTGSTNAIEFYEVYVNGVYNRTVTASGQYITGLSLNTAYTIEVKPVDIFYNKSTSNVVSATTATTGDVDAENYITAANLSGVELDSAYQLITDLKTAGLWTKIQALYPFKGTTAAQHKWNAKNPLDTDAAFRLVFGGTGTYSNLGFQCNGTNAYANTKLIPSANQNVNSNGLTLVCGTNNATANPDITDMAVYQSETQISLLTLKGRNTDFYKETLLNNRASSVKSVGVNDAKGILTGVRQSVNVTKLFKGGFLLGSPSSAGGSLCTIPIYIGGINVSNAPSAFSNQRIQIAVIHEGLSDVEVATLHSIIDLSEAIAGRKTW